MANCQNCGAPLTGTLLVCSYCKTRQDVDLSVVHRYTVEEPRSKRLCPRCHVFLQTVDLELGEKFLIERCSNCLGLFFDPGELEAFLAKAVTNVHAVDRQRLDEVQNVKRSREYPVTYIDCPVCRKLMNRINFGPGSGVIADQCRYHGLWLDGGELRQILEWTKAGGDLQRRQRDQEIAQLAREQEKINQKFRVIDESFEHSRSAQYHEPKDFELRLLPMLEQFLKKMFR
jgi:Zn-finger nucleic acid-binding protein